MKYGININGLDTFSVLGLVLCNDIKISSPVQKRETIDIPGADGVIDLSFALNQDPVFKQRTITFTLVCDGNYQEFIMASKIMMLYHGRICDLILPMDLGHHWHGAVKVEPDYKFGSNKIAMTLTADPYALKNIVTSSLVTIPSSGTTSVNFISELMPVCPSFYLVSGTVNAGGHLVEADVDNVYDDVKLRYGKNTIVFTGTSGSVVRVTYQEGTL